MLAVSAGHNTEYTDTKDEMKRILSFTLIIVSFLIGFALKTFLTKQSNEISLMEKRGRQIDEDLIRKTETTYDNAWQQGDIEGVVACFTEDAVLISPRGDVAIGKEQIRKLFNDFLGSEAKNTKHTGRITRIGFVADNVAVVDGEALIEGTAELSASVAHHRFTDILVRSGDDWLIDQIRAYAVF